MADVKLFYNGLIGIDKVGSDLTSVLGSESTMSLASPCVEVWITFTVQLIHKKLRKIGMIGETYT